MTGGFDVHRVIAEFDALTTNAVAAQRETLRRILQANSSAEYLRKLGISGETDDEETFKARAPLISHSHIEPSIRRIVDGDPSPLLTSEPITGMSLSSGTTKGKPKYLPFNEQLAAISMQVFRTSFAFRERDFPIGKEGKALQFIYGSRVSTSRGGVTITTGTSNLYRSRLFRSTMAEIRSECTSPPEVIFGSDFRQSLYCHLLCGLLHSSDVKLVSSSFAHSIVLALRALEQLWPDLCSDIRRGILSERVTDPKMREAVSTLLSPDPDLAGRIETACSNLTNWYGVIPRLWPNCKYVYGIMTGSMEPYLKKLRHYAGEVPVVCADYGASEGWVGVVTDPRTRPEETTFTVVPDVAYFEFLPLDDGEEQKPVGIAGVRVGAEYEVVLTTFTGLYRYRLGDVVRVIGFYNSAPRLSFLHRRSLALCINIDKNTEKDLQISVEEAAKLVEAEKVEVIDFTSMADCSGENGHYVVFWELSGIADGEVLSACADCLDRSFVDIGYVGSRRAGAIGPLELRLVRRGTFQRVMEHYLGMGAAVSQFKTPRCVGPSNRKVLHILEQGVVGTYFSTAYDRC